MCVLSLSAAAHAEPIDPFVQLSVGGQDVPGTVYVPARATVGLRGSFAEHFALTGWGGVGHSAGTSLFNEYHASGWDADFGLAGEVQLCSEARTCGGLRLGVAAEYLEYEHGDQDPDSMEVWMVAPSVGPYVSFGDWVVAADVRPGGVTALESKHHLPFDERGRVRWAGYLNVGRRF